MPVIFVNLNKQDTLKKEPYLSFLKKFDLIKQSLDGESIELRVGGKEGSFTNGFYVDEMFYMNPRLRIDFADIPSEQGEKNRTFIRVCYSYEGEDGYDLDFHLQRIKDIRKRVGFFYVPDATHFEFSSQIDDEYRLIFDVLVEDETAIPRVCCSLISHIIAIFSLDN